MTEEAELPRPVVTGIDISAAIQREVTTLLKAAKQGRASLDIEDQGLVFDVCDKLCAALSHTPALANKIADLLETFAQSQSTLGVYARVFVTHHTCTLPDLDPSRVHIFDGISKQGDDFSTVVWHRTIMGDRTSRVNQTDLTTYLAQANRYQLLLYVGTNKDMSLHATELAYNIAYDSPMPDTVTNHVHDIKPAIFEAAKALHTLQKMPITHHDLRAKLIQTLQRSLVHPQASARAAFRQAAKQNSVRVILRLNVPALARLNPPTKIQPAKQTPSARAAFRQAAKQNSVRVILRLNVPALARLNPPTKTQPTKQQPAVRAPFRQTAKPNPARIIQRLNVPVLVRLKAPVKTQTVKEQPPARNAFKQAAKPNPAWVTQKLIAPSLVRIKANVKAQVRKLKPSPRSAFKVAAKQNLMRIIQKLNVPALAYMKPKPALRQVMRVAASQLRGGINARRIKTTLAHHTTQRTMLRPVTARAVFKQVTAMRNTRAMPLIFVPALAQWRPQMLAEKPSITASSPTIFLDSAPARVTNGSKTEPAHINPSKPAAYKRRQVMRTSLDPRPAAPAMPTVPSKQKLPLHVTEKEPLKRTPLHTGPAPLRPELAPKTDVKKDMPTPAALPQTPDRPINPQKGAPILNLILNPIKKPIPILKSLLHKFTNIKKVKYHTEPNSNKPIKPIILTNNGTQIARSVKEPQPPASPPEMPRDKGIQLNDKGDIKDCCKEAFKKVVEDAVARAVDLAMQQAAMNTTGALSPLVHDDALISATRSTVSYTSDGVVLRSKDTGEARIISHAELKHNEDAHARLTAELQNQTSHRKNPLRPKR